MEVYQSHVDFEKETGKSVNQQHYITAFLAEHKEEVERLRQNRTLRRLTVSANSEINETIHNRFLDWYKNGSNAFMQKSTSNLSAKEVYSVVTSSRQAAIFIFALRCLHDSKGK